MCGCNNACQSNNTVVQQCVDIPFDIAVATGGESTIYTSPSAINATGLVNNATSSVTSLIVTFLRSNTQIFTITVQVGDSVGFTVNKFDTITVSSTGIVSGNVCLQTVYILT
jgi:hypothetical protein